MPVKFRGLYNGLKYQLIVRLWRENCEYLVILDANKWITKDFLKFGKVTLFRNLANTHYRDLSGVNPIVIKAPSEDATGKCLYFISQLNPHVDDMESYSLLQIDFSAPSEGEHSFKSEIRKFDSDRILTRGEVNEGYKILIIKVLEPKFIYSMP